MWNLEALHCTSYIGPILLNQYWYYQFNRPTKHYTLVYTLVDVLANRQDLIAAEITPGGYTKGFKSVILWPENDR